MSPAPTPWRPTSPADLERIQNHVVEAVGSWLQEWFSQPNHASAQATTIGSSTPSAPADATEWTLGAHVRWMAVPRAWESLPREALDLLESEAFHTGHPSGALLDHVRADLQSDLLKHLCGTLGLGPSNPMPLARPVSKEQAAREEVHVVCRLDDGQPLFHMHFSAPWRWQKREAARQPSKKAIALTKRTESLDETRVKVLPLIGRCELSVAELAGLAVGDVIATHQLLTASLDIAALNADGSPGHIFAEGRPGLTLGRTTLQVISIKDISP